MYNLLNIKQVAIDKGYTIKDLVREAKVTEQGFYKSLENNSMNIKTLAVIAEILGVTISELINDRKENAQKNIHKKSLVSSPVTIYSPPEEKAELKQIMHEQQIEIAGLLKEKIGWMEKAHALEMELERVKKMNAPEKDALAG